MRIALTALLAASAVAFTVVYYPLATPVSAKNCKDVIFVFARGSGQDLDATDYQTYRSAIKTAIKEKNLDIDYSFYELGTATYNNARYPAVALNFMNTITAIISAGSAFDYGKSIEQGTLELTGYIQNITSSCSNTKFVLAGYSQGAQVISKSISQLNSKKILYVATFGDPKSYLPEGKGVDPPACHDKDLSPYRAYVPNCRTYKGSLGAKIPYQELGWDQKIGLYCNNKDLVCGAGLSLSTSGDTSLSFIERLKQNAMSAHTTYFSPEKLSLVSNNIIKRITAAKSAASYNADQSNQQQSTPPNSTTNISEPWSIPSAEPMLNTESSRKIVLLDYKLISNNVIDYQKMQKFLTTQFSPNNTGYFTFYNTPAFDNGTKDNVYFYCNPSPTNNVITMDCVNIAWGGIAGSMVSISDGLLSRLDHTANYWSFTTDKQFIAVISNESLLANPNLANEVKKIQENTNTRITILTESQVRAMDLATTNLNKGDQVSIKDQERQSKPEDNAFLAIKNLLMPVKNLLFQKNASATSNEYPFSENSLPTISNLGYVQADNLTTIKFSYGGSAAAAYIALDDAPLGLTEQSTILITDVKPSSKLLMTPIGQDGTIGEQVELVLGEPRSETTFNLSQKTTSRLDQNNNTNSEGGSSISHRSIPLVPDCGKI